MSLLCARLRKKKSYADPCLLRLKIAIINFMENIPIQKHVGVYGVAIKDGNILLIKKSRGPYAGMYDLPGGKIEDGEEIEDALHREFVEEVGCEIKELSFLTEAEDSIEYMHPDQGNTLFEHSGTYYNVVLSDYCEVEETPDEPFDAEWINLQDAYDGKIKVPNIVKKVLDCCVASEII